MRAKVSGALWFIDLIIRLLLSAVVPSTGSAGVPAFDPAAQVVLAGDGRVLTIPAEHLAEAAIQMNADGPYLVFRLNDTDSAAMADLTGALIGRTVTVSVCGTVLAEPVVRERIAGAGIVPAGELAHAFALADALNGRGPCPMPE